MELERAAMETVSAERGQKGARQQGSVPALLGVVALGATYGVTQSWIAALAAAVVSTAVVHATVQAQSRRG